MREREADARYVESGMTDRQRDQTILALDKRGFSRSQIGARLGLSQQGVSVALKRLRGQKRRRVTRELCDGCFEDYPAPQLDKNGLCTGCRSV